MFLVSIHVNAARMAKCIRLDVYVCQGQTQSYKLAESLCLAAIKNFPGRRIRAHFSDADRDWEEGFYTLRKSLCVAILTENFFMDSKSDLEYLQSRAGKQAVVNTHVEGIVDWL